MLVRSAIRAAFLTLLACLSIALAVPAVAAAESWQVDSKADTKDEDPGDGICKAAVVEGACTLRAAIEELDEGTDAGNEITFDPAVFDGEETDTIFLGSELPPLENPVTIDAGSSCTVAGVVGAPCAGVTGYPGLPAVFAVWADDVSISGLAISKGAMGIWVFRESTGFRARGNWIGLPLDDSITSIVGVYGIYLAFNSDEAVIGGTEAADRNVFGFVEVGLSINGASDTVVQGNWFGIKADGETPAVAATGIEVADHGISAEGNEIGAVLDADARESSECDGGCNVIASATANGIDLDGTKASELPASGPTTIHGNYVGLDPTGTEAVDNGSYEGNQDSGIEAAGADHVTIGGDPDSEVNYIVGGDTGVSTKNGDDFEARGNVFGYNTVGAEATPQANRAIFASAAPTLEHPTIADNRIRMGEGGTGIEHFRVGATIHGNTVTGGEVGISSEEPAGTSGSAIGDNRIEDTEGNGIFLSTPNSRVLGNEILHAGATGIEVESPTAADDGNVIGGDSVVDENAIFDSGAFGILIHGTEATRNEIGRNHGAGNLGDGGFIALRAIDLVPDEKDPNGIERPTIVSAGRTEASGKGVPGALVRIFFKASSEKGELGGFLGESVADVNGVWNATYTAVPAETLVTATQTHSGGTSELAETVKTPPNPPPAAGGASLATPSSISPARKPLRCRKGSVKKKVKGKLRCVKRKRKRKRASPTRPRAGHSQKSG